MAKHVLITGMAIALALMMPVAALSQEDRIAQAAIDTFKAQIRLPKGTEIRFVEKKESPVSDFYSVKLLLVFPDKEVPAVLYVHQDGEKVFIGNLFIKGENVTLKEAGPPKSKKIDMTTLEIDKSSSLGPKGAKVTIVEFSNFQCPYCQDSWSRLKPLIEKHPKEIRYIFKHLPFQSEGKTFELSEMAAAAQEVGSDAFWLVHDFLFTAEGQALVKLEKKAIQAKIEQLLHEKKYDIKTFQETLENGKAKKRVLEDIAVGNKLRLTGTPTKIVNGNLMVGPTPENVLERYLGK